MQTHAFTDHSPDALLADYRRDGVVRVTGLLTPAELTGIRRQLDTYIANRLDSLPPGDYTREADGAAIRNLWRLQVHEPWFASFAARDDFHRLLAPLLHGSPETVGVETFNKPARVGSQVPYHQDNAYFSLVPPDVLTLWIAIDPVTPANGPVEYLLGSHRDLLPHVPSGVRGNSYGLPADFTGDGWERSTGTLAPGDALVHHGQTIHRSSPNTSDQPRLSLVTVYQGPRARRDERLWAAYQAAAATV